MTHITKGVETLKILDPKSNLTSTIQSNINISTVRPSGETRELAQREQIKTNENTTEQVNPYSTNNMNEHLNNLQDINYNSSNEIINELNFLRKVLDIYMSQTLVFKNKKILCTAEELIDLIKTITNNAENIELETSLLDSSCGCINTEQIPILDVDKIWILSNQDRRIFKYSYPQAISLFERYNISLKYIKC